MRGLIGKKIGMSRIFDDLGAVIPVTLLELGPCAIIQIKNIDKDGYDAVQVGYGTSKQKKSKKPKLGHFNKYGLSLTIKW